MGRRLVVMVGVVDEHAPGFSSGIIDMQVLTPPDIEAIIGSPHTSARTLSGSRVLPRRACRMATMFMNYGSACL